MLSSEELAAIEERAEAATPGPWTSEHDSWAGDNAVLSVPYDGHAVAVCGEEVKGSDYPASKDAVFIAATRTDVPRLVAEVRQLQDRVTELEATPVEWDAQRRRADRAEAEVRNVSGERDVARSERDQALAAIERVREIHAGIGIYADCGHDHQSDEPGVKDILVVGLVCADGHRYTICRTCCTENGGDQTEECASRHRPHCCYPCPTLRALDAAPSNVWMVPKRPHDQDAAVGPIIRPGGLIARAAGVSDPDHTRVYAAQLYAAADAVEAGQDGGDATYRCDRCGDETAAATLPAEWRTNGDSKICGACWREVEAEATAERAGQPADGGDR